MFIPKVPELCEVPGVLLFVLQITKQNLLSPTNDVKTQRVDICAQLCSFLARLGKKGAVQTGGFQTAYKELKQLSTA